MDNDLSLTEANRQLVRAAYQAAIAGNFSEFLDSLDSDIVVHRPSSLPGGGTYKGIADVQAMLSKLGEFIDPASLQIDSLIADGNNVIGLIRLKRTQGDGEVQVAEHFVIKNGKAAELKIYIHETDPPA